MTDTLLVLFGYPNLSFSEESLFIFRTFFAFGFGSVFISFASPRAAGNNAAVLKRKLDAIYNDHQREDFLAVFLKTFVVATRVITYRKVLAMSSSLKD